ncbi:MAG: hypothetical protein JNJ82_01860 [Opitutaceae bacterium]|nr:hypothetical protein [Opitutaceae bacterium]
MKSLRLLAWSAPLGLVATLHAQPNSEIPIEFRQIRNNAFSVGVRYIGGADIKFGNLGTVPSQLSIPALTGSAQPISYTDGAISLDALRDNEKDADGNQTSTPGGRYTTSGVRVDANGNPILDDAGNPVTQITGDYVSYTAGFTRTWAYVNASQVTSNPGFVAMHDYSAESSGATATASSDSGAGFEFTATRKFGSFGGKIELGVLFGFGITDINGKVSGDIKSNLKTLTDLYSLGGRAAPAAPFTGPTTEAYIGADGTAYSGALETTVPLAAFATSRTNTTTPNGANISGTWQIKGAYYLFRVGPMVRIPIGQRFAMTFSGGYAGAYLGTKYRVDETLNVEGTSPNQFQDEDTYSKFMSGVYAEANFEWLLTDRTGFFAGATVETLGKYEQKLGSRTAAVDIGGNVGFRFGITTRF